MTADQTFVIVGAGLAGAKAAQTLREDGFDGRVVLVGAMGAGKTTVGRLLASAWGTTARDTDAGVVDVIRMASLTPAELTGFAHDRGSLEPGKLADIVILSRDLQVIRTFIGGVEFDEGT